MNKELKDYLHLYLGCDLVSVATGKVVGRMEGIVAGNAHFRVSGIWYSGPITNYKLALRHLSDMTEEEKRMVGFEAYQVLRKDDFGSNVIPSKVVGFMWAAKQTSYLLSKHFDLFGLIEAGLAIDKTKIKNNE